MKVSDLIVNKLINIGVEYVFTLPGGFSMHLNDSIGHSALKPIYMLHESGAAFAAAAYAQYSGKLGVVCITAGPGGTNALTGITSAWLDSLPVLVISGDVRVPHLWARERWNLRQGGPQDAPIEEMAAGITKYFVTSSTGLRIPEVFDYAVEIAMRSRRGPTWINIPLDIQAQEVPDDSH